MAFANNVDTSAPYVVYTFDKGVPVPRFAAKNPEPVAAWLKERQAYKTRRGVDGRYTLATSSKAYLQGH